jgi:hypothetical protein
VTSLRDVVQLSTSEVFFQSPVVDYERRKLYALTCTNPVSCFVIGPGRMFNLTIFDLDDLHAPPVTFQHEGNDIEEDAFLILSEDV